VSRRATHDAHAQMLALLRDISTALGNGADIPDDDVPAAFDTLNNPCRSHRAVLHAMDVRFDDEASVSNSPALSNVFFSAVYDLLRLLANLCARAGDAPPFAFAGLTAST
jgi:hypothetical protein